MDPKELFSLEGLDQAQILQLAATGKALFNHPETRREAQRLVRKVDPNATSDVLDLDERLQKQEEEFRKRLDEEKKEREMERLQNNRTRTLERLQSSGYVSADDVAPQGEGKLTKFEQFMVDNKIGDYDAAARFWKQQQEAAIPAAQPNPLPSSPALPTIDLKAAGVQNYNQWARNEAMAAINEIQTGKVRLPSA